MQGLFFRKFTVSVKRRVKFGGNFFKQNYCHACHTGFAVFFPLPVA